MDRGNADDCHVVALTLSGQRTVVPVRADATLGDIKDAIAAQLAVPSRELVIAHDTIPLDCLHRLAFDDVGIEIGAEINVVYRPFPPLIELPSQFHINLVSTRRRLGKGVYSSAFHILYNLKMDLENSSLSASVSRKNDTDTVAMNGKTGIRSGETQHWMTGSQPFEYQGPCFDLKALISQWFQRCEPVHNPDLQLWTTNEVAETDGWFLRPKEECFELYVNAPLPGLTRTPDLRLARVLLNTSGRPIRAALNHAREESPRRRRDDDKGGDCVRSANPMDMARDGQSACEEYDVAVRW